MLTWIYPTVAPGIYIGLTLFTACAYLLKREGWNFNFLLIALFLSAGLQLAFYKIFGSGLAPESSTSAVPMSWPEILLSMKAYASQGIKIITRYVFPVALVYFFARKTFMLSAIEKRALEFFVIIGFGGLLFAGLPQHSMVASQLGANLMGPILIVFSFIMFQKVITATPHPSKLSIAVIGILLASCFLLSLANGVYSKPSRIERYSRDYLASVSAFVTKSKNKLGVFIADSSFFDGVLNKNEDYHYLGKYLKLVSPDTYVFNLMPDQLHLNLRDNTERMFYQRSVYSLLHKKYPLIQSDSLRIQMLYELNPSFLLTSKNIAIPDYIKKHLSDSIVDKKSGERFFIIESNRR